MITEISGKFVVGYGRYGSYEDFDGDGRSELFEYVSDSPWPYISTGFVRSSYRQENAVGCELWFSDGEQTVLVSELEDGYVELSMDVLQFGDSLQCALTRLIPDQYVSIEDVLAADGYATTVCTVENGNPQVIMLDENMRFYQKEDREEIGAYSPYGALRPDDYVVYKNGGYYWGSDSAPVLE